MAMDTDRLRKASRAVYIVVAGDVAKRMSKLFEGSADEIDELRLQVASLQEKLKEKS